jgi:hypothetical protein
MAHQKVCLFNPGVDCDGGSCESCGWGKKGKDLTRLKDCFEIVPKQPEKPKNPYWERICELSDKQRAKGMETYGQGLESNPADMLKRIEHLQEELIDGLMYCEWIKDKLTEKEGELND